MKRQVFQWLLYGVLISVFTLGAAAAVIQEPVLDQPGSFQTRFLFMQDSISPGQQVPGRQVEAVRKTADEAVVFASDGRSFIKASYVRPTAESVGKIVNKYKSIPGGVTLEGSLDGIGEIRSVEYDAVKNEFRINGRWILSGVLNPSETRRVFEAISRDDLFGVSLGREDLVYGALPNGSLSCIFMKMADHYLGSIVFAAGSWVRHHSFPGGYRPRPDIRTGGVYAVYFNLDGFSVEKRDGRLVPSGADLEITLVPLTDQTNEEGGHLPDYLALAQNRVSSAFESNIGHIVRNISVYEKDSRLQKVIAVGQTASLARLIRDSGITVQGLFPAASGVL